MPRVFEYPACNTFNATVWICFDTMNPDKCKSFDGKALVDEKSAAIEHFITSLGAYRGQPFALGGYSPNNREVEIMEEEWISLGPFPFVRDWIAYYSTVTFKDELYIFGRLKVKKILYNLVT